MKEKLLKFSWLVLIAILLITVASVLVMKKYSRLETNLDKYMPENHPAFVYSNKAEKWFHIKDAVVIAIENKSGVFNYSTLKKIKDITKKLQRMKEIKRTDVTSLYTADNIVSSEGSLDVKKFYKRVPKDKESLENLKKEVENNEMIFGRLVSRDETVAIILARIDNDIFTQEFYNRILSMAKEYEGPEKIYVAGRPIVEGTLAYLMPKDMKRMVPIVVFVIIIVLLLVLRSFKSTFFTLMVVLISTLWTFGLMAALHIPIYAVTTMIPVMLIAIGVAYGIHLYNHLQLFIKENPNASKKEAVHDMLSEMWKPVLMTAITTMVGFISLLTSQVYPVKYFGVFAAFGVFIALILSLGMIPASIYVFGMPGFKKQAGEETPEKSFYFRATDRIIKAKPIILIITILVVGISIYGISKVWISSSFLAKFETNSDIRKTDRFINEHFGGTTTLNVILEGKDKDTIKKPEVLRTILEMQKEVEKLPLVGSSFSLGDFIKRMNKVMHADREEYDTIPDNQNLIAQYLLLYEMSGDPENLARVADYKYKKANVTFQLKSDDSKALKEAIAVIEKFKDKLKKEGIEIHYAGSGYKALVFTDLLLEGQIKSLLLSLVIVVILLTIMFKKFSIGLIGAIPITITTIVTFGVMGLLNIPLSSTTALISSIAIGIGIDYAIHFIDRYRIYAARTGNKELTSRLTMYHSGRAIFYNALVVIAGFMVLVFSVFPPNRTLGALVSMNMLVSFLGTITIMFIILYIKNTYFKRRKV
ncbi:MAG: MMPL family transporter [Candidatus Aminicenantes bacterium]|nr:MMPL family transporter [Candidatus Aminicenantes bacterium]